MGWLKRVADTGFAALFYLLNLIISLSKYTAANSNQGGSFLDGNSIITAHTHRKNIHRMWGNFV